MVIADAQKALAPPEASDLPHLILREIEDVLDEPGLLLLHLHDQLDAAGVQDALAVLAALQPEEVLHPLGGGDRYAAQAPDGFHHLQHKAGGLRVGASAHQRPQLVRQQGGELRPGVHDEVVGHVGGPEGAVGDHIVGEAGDVQHNEFVVQQHIIAPAHGGGGAGDIPGEDHRQVPCLGVPLQDIVPVGENGHLLEISVRIQQGAVVKVDAVPLVALHQGGIQAALVLLAQIPLLQGEPDDEP